MKESLESFVLEDLKKQFKKEADLIEDDSRKEEGTLAAYQRGYAAGLRYVSKKINSKQVSIYTSGFIAKTKPNKSA